MKNIVLPKIQKENGFTAIRIFCALIVVYEHTIVLTGTNFPILDLRGITVNIFFILSGFWVTFSYVRSSSLKEYYVKRFKKIFPLYWSVVIGFAILFVFVSSLSIKDYFTNKEFWKYLVANICTLNFIHPNLPGVFNEAPVNGSLWTIKIELGFYIFLPIIVYLCFGKLKENNGGDCLKTQMTSVKFEGKRQKTTLNMDLEEEKTTKKVVFRQSGGGYRCLVILILIYLLSAFYGVLMPLVSKKFNLPSSITNQLPAYMSFFVSGMACFFMFEKLEPLLNKLIFIALPLLIICLIFKNIYLSAFLEPAALSIIVMYFALKLRFLFLFSKIRDFSYPLYLIHYPIIMLIKEYV